MNLSDRISELIHACFTGLWVQSCEHEDALAEIAELCRRERGCQQHGYLNSIAFSKTSYSSVSILTPSFPPRPFTPESESEHEDFHDHSIPSSQMAQKIPRLLDIEINPSSLGNL